MQSTTSSVESLQNDAPVKLELYYESLCFACQNFISGPLQKAWKSLQNSGTYVSSKKHKCVRKTSKIMEKKELFMWH